MGTSPSGTIAPARRRLPANLSQAQRLALEQFIDGQISAGALSARLDQAEPAGPGPEPDWRPSHRAPTGSRRRESTSAPATAERPAVRTAPRRRMAFPVILVSALLLGIVGAFTVASASTSSERLGRPAAAGVMRTSHHRRARRSQSALVSPSSSAATTAPQRAHRGQHHPTPAGRTHGRGKGGKDAPGRKLGGKAIGKPAGPAPTGGGQSPTGTGGAGSQPGGGAPAGGNPTPGQSTTPSGTSTSGSGSGTTSSPAPSTGGTTTSAS